MHEFPRRVTIVGFPPAQALDITGPLDVFAMANLVWTASHGGPAPDPQRFAPLLKWMASHLVADLSVPALADRAAMSPRNFARSFQEAMRLTPARYVRLLRVDAARRLLTGSRQSIARIAERCGFPSEEAMRVAFRTQMKVSPAEFRARFRSTA